MGEERVQTVKSGKSDLQRPPRSIESGQTRWNSRVWTLSCSQVGDIAPRTDGPDPVYEHKGSKTVSESPEIGLKKTKTSSGPRSERVRTVGLRQVLGLEAGFPSSERPEGPGATRGRSRVRKMSSGPKSNGVQTVPKFGFFFKIPLRGSRLPFN